MLTLFLVLLNCVREKEVLVSDYCDLYYTLPNPDNLVLQSWTNLEASYEAKEKDKKELNEAERFFKYIMQYTIINEERYYQKCSKE